MKAFLVFAILFAFFAFSSAQSTCGICQEICVVAEYGIKYEGWNATDVINEFDVICTYLGPLESQCETLVTLFGTSLANCLVKQQNTTACCQDVDLCSSQQIVRLPKAVKTQGGLPQKRMMKPSKH